MASAGLLSAFLIQGIVILNYPQYNPQRWHGTLLLWAVILVAALTNTIIGSLLPMLEGLILIIHVLGFFAILIPLVCMSPHGSASDVFTNFVNEGGWSSQGLSFWVGIIGNVFAFIGESPIKSANSGDARGPNLTVHQIPTELYMFAKPCKMIAHSLIDLIYRCPKRSITHRKSYRIRCFPASR